jgi:hypothetical protein
MLLNTCYEVSHTMKKYVYIWILSCVSTNLVCMHNGDKSFHQAIVPSRLVAGAQKFVSTFNTYGKKVVPFMLMTGAQAMNQTSNTTYENSAIPDVMSSSVTPIPVIVASIGAGCMILLVTLCSTWTAISERKEADREEIVVKSAIRKRVLKIKKMQATDIKEKFVTLYGFDLNNRMKFDTRYYAGDRHYWTYDMYVSKMMPYQLLLSSNNVFGGLPPELRQKILGYTMHIDQEILDLPWILLQRQPIGISTKEDGLNVLKTYELKCFLR